MSYIIWSGVGIVLFYLLDVLLLRYSNMLKVQRWYYIIAIILSLTLPLLSSLIPSIRVALDSVTLPSITITYQLSDIGIDGALSQDIANPLLASPIWSYPWWMNLLTQIWLIGIGIMAIRLLIGWVTIRRIIKGSEQKEIGRAILHIVDKKIAPFTYRNRIVISRATINEPIFDSIIRHEMEHVQQKHYRDLTLGVLLQLLQWWNPFAWSLLHRQRNTLEYLADQGVLSSGVNKKMYQLHMLQGAVGRSMELPLLSFSVQNIKKRIIMMNSQKKNKRWASVLCALSSLPIAALLIFSTQLVNAKPTYYHTDSNTQVVTSLEEDNTAITMTPPTISELQIPTMDNPPADEEDPVYEFLDNGMPEFPGGMAELMKWLSYNVKYPAEAVEKNLQGQVFVKFIIEKDGSVSNPTIEKGVHKLLDDEALRVVGIMPKWQPGVKDGKTVRVRYVFPLTFKLSEPTKSPEAKP